MKVTYDVDPGLNQRSDLIETMKAAGEYLRTRDDDPNSSVRAIWKLWAAPSGQPLIGVGVQEGEWNLAKQFAPAQSIPTEIREHRLLEIWTDVLGARTRREVHRVNELIRQFGGDAHGDEN